MGKFWIENELVDDWLYKISGNELKVLLCLTRHYNKAGTTFVSIAKMAKLLNLNPETVSKSVKRLNLLGFFEQIVIRERTKLRYIFSKTARNLFIETNKLPEKPESKEAFKEIIKETPKEILKRSNPKAYEKFYGRSL